MTADEPTRENGHEGDEPTENETAASAALDADPNREVLSTRLDVLGTRTSADLHGLAARVEAGDDLDAEEVREARANLRRADAALRRHLDAPEEGDGLGSEEIEASEASEGLDGFGEIEDADHLREAPVEEVAHRLAADVHDLRTVADRVDRNLYAEDLTDRDAEALWSAGARLAAWGRDVLVFRTDRDVLDGGEVEGEAVEAVDGEEVEDA